MGWISPSSGGGASWTDDANSYNGNVGDYAYDEIPASGTSTWLTWSFDPGRMSDGCRIYLHTDTDYYARANIEVEVYSDGSWTNVLDGAMNKGSYVSLSWSRAWVTVVRLRSTNNYSAAKTICVADMDLSEDETSEIALADVGAFYKFNEKSGTNAEDFSSNGNDGTLTSMTTPTSWVDGKVQGGLDFGNDANGYVNIGTDSTIRQTLNPPAAFSFWMYIDAWPANIDWIFQTSSNSGTPSRYAGFMGMLNSDGKLWIQFGDNEGSGVGNRNTMLSNETIPIGSWVHIAAIRDGYNKGRLWINRVEDTGVTFSGTETAVTHGDTIGMIGHKLDLGADRDFEGKLDAFILLNTGITQYNVDWLNNAGRGRENLWDICVLRRRRSV